MRLRLLQMLAMPLIILSDMSSHDCYTVTILPDMTSHECYTGTMLPDMTWHNCYTAKIIPDMTWHNYYTVTMLTDLTWHDYYTAAMLPDMTLSGGKYVHDILGSGEYILEACSQTAPGHLRLSLRDLFIQMFTLPFRSIWKSTKIFIKLLMWPFVWAFIEPSVWQK